MSRSLVLRVCRADMTSYGGFTWPSQGHVEAPDWEPTEDCGKGLHGWLNAEGDYTSSSFHADIEAKYLVLEVETTKVIELDGKCKFPSAEVLFTGGMVEALTFIEKLRPELKSKPLLFATRTAGKYGTATAGYKGTAIAGDFGTATAGKDGTATAGNDGTIQILYSLNNHKRVKMGYIGEEGLMPNVAYMVDSKFNFIIKEEAK